MNVARVLTLMFMFKVSNKDLKFHAIYNGIRSDYRAKKNNCVSVNCLLTIIFSAYPKVVIAIFGQAE